MGARMTKSEFIALLQMLKDADNIEFGKLSAERIDVDNLVRIGPETSGHIKILSNGLSIYEYDLANRTPREIAYFKSNGAKIGKMGAESDADVVICAGAWVEDQGGETAQYANAIEVYNVSTKGGKPTVKVNGFRVPEIQTGRVQITPSAVNTPTKKSITFDNQFSGVPMVTVSPISTVPGTQITGCSVNNVTSTGFEIYLTRTNKTETGVMWQAIY